MPVKRTDTNHFIYILYDRRSGLDFEALKRELATLMRSGSQSQAVVADLSRLRTISNAEVETLFKFAFAVKQLWKSINLIINEEIRYPVVSRNPAKIGLYIYDSREAFTDAVRNSPGLERLPGRKSDTQHLSSLTAAGAAAPGAPAAKPAKQ